jgi:ribonucleotide reductase beta subunit family protein with ferritin-like domain
MEMLSLQGKTNFFEKRVSDYSLARVSDQIHANSETQQLWVVDDF